jgi:OmpA-OmpF porin, OOP family
MDFLSRIKKAISAQTIENLASFLGERTENVDSGLDLSLNTFMAGLLKYAHSDVEIKNIINILNDGGHTGDILNNLESFSNNFEKTQLLVTIGNNISAHFVGNKVPNLVEKIAGISEVRKTSAASLLSLSAPVVLGFIGKAMRDNQMDSVGLRSFFRDLNDGVINALPPAINNIFQFKKTTNSLVSATVTPLKPQKEKAVSRNKTNWSVILPWIILAIAGLSVLYYAKFAKNQNAKTNLETHSIAEKPETNLQPEDFLPDSSVAALPVEKNVVVTEPNELPQPSQEESDKIKELKEPVKVVSPKPAEKKVVEATPAQKRTETTRNGTISNERNTSEVKTPAGWNSLRGDIFKKNSAEISNSSMVSSIINQLKNSTKSIKISPLNGGNKTLGEDRAYALREILIEKGIEEDRISVTSALQGSNSNGIAYRISN